MIGRFSDLAGDLRYAYRACETRVGTSTRPLLECVLGRRQYLPYSSRRVRDSPERGLTFLDETDIACADYDSDRALAQRIAHLQLAVVPARFPEADLSLGVGDRFHHTETWRV